MGGLGACLIGSGIGLLVGKFAAAQPRHFGLAELDRIMSMEQNGHRASEDMKSKEVSVEVQATKGGEVLIDNTSRSVSINVWDQPRVKVTTMVYYEGDASKLSDMEWFEKLNLNVKQGVSGVKIKSGTVSGSGTYQVMGNSFNWSSTPPNGTAVFNSEGETIKTKRNLKRILTITVPKDAKVNLESKYADIEIVNPLVKLVADITNGNLEGEDVQRLALRSKYANVSFGNIKEGEIEFVNGHFTAKDCGKLELDTKYSNVDLASVDDLDLVSTNDEYELEEVGALHGRKSYGNIRINKLTAGFEMDGTNADIKVKNIAQSVKSIKIDDKYANLRLPLKNVTNYSIDYAGQYSTVFGNFEKKHRDSDENGTVTTTVTNHGKETRIEKIKIIKKSTDDEAPAPPRPPKMSFGADDDAFTAKGGDGKGIAIKINCQNCTVDFK